MKGLIFFDFDGTIADSLAVAEEVIHEIGPEFGLPPASRAELLEWKSKSVLRLMEITGISWLQIPKIMQRAQASFQQKREQVPIIAGMKEVLQTLSTMEYELHILTSNSQKNVKYLLEKYEIPFFTAIHAPNALFGKAAVIKKISKPLQLAPTQIWMVGDEVRDVAAGNEARVQSVAVTWGFNSKSLLLTENPTFCVETPEALLRLFE